MNGKGDTPRSMNRVKYDAGYERVFGTEEQVRVRRQVHIVQQKIARARVEPGFVVPMENHFDVLAANMRAAMNKPREFTGDLSSPATIEHIRKAMKMPLHRMFPEKIMPDKGIINVKPGEQYGKDVQ